MPLHPICILYVPAALLIGLKPQWLSRVAEMQCSSDDRALRSQALLIRSAESADSWPSVLQRWGSW